MPALTLTQPWASLVALGAKQIETRSWSTSYRGLLAIHAAKGWTAADRELCNESPFAEALSDYAIRNSFGDWGVDPDALPRGCIIAIADLYDIVRIGSDTIGRVWLKGHLLLGDELDFGNYAPGRYAWLLGSVRRIEPVPAKGALGLWQWEPPVGLAPPEWAQRPGEPQGTACEG